LKIAMELFAEHDPEGFLRFTEVERQRDLMIVHRLMSYGFVRLAATTPPAVVDYLTGDPRRLALGGYDDRHKEMNLVIAAVSARVNTQELARLEHWVLEFTVGYLKNDVQQHNQNAPAAIRFRG
jgi:hypothetical protein